MSTNLNIAADVVDIGQDQPRPQDIFLVDTNIWLWQTYGPSIPPRPDVQQKIGTYSRYFRSARGKGATLAYSWLLLFELAHVIESTERSIYEQQVGRTIRAKDYRHNYPRERQNVTAEVENVWKQIQSMAVPASDLMIDESLANTALARFKTQALDGYDLLIVESILQAGAGEIKILTDDMDYVTVPNIKVFTLNPLVLRQAKQQGKLLIR
jgi:predicted nucleic acid-binding protein